MFTRIITGHSETANEVVTRPMSRTSRYGSLARRTCVSFVQLLPVGECYERFLCITVHYCASRKREFFLGGGEVEEGTFLFDRKLMFEFFELFLP